MRRCRWQLLLLVLLLLCAAQAGLARPARADDKTYHWDYIDVDITIQPNGDLDIVERHCYVFTEGSFTYAYRDVPLTRVESIDDVWVEEDGQRYGSDRLRVEHRDASLRITWYYPSTRNASRTFDLHYRARGALRIYEGGDQLYWKAIFSDRDFAVLRSRVTVHLPAALAGADLKVASYGVSAEYEVVDSQTVRFATGRVRPGEELEVRIQFPHGLLAAGKPSWQD
ncbi:MAG: DUF2207 domain-containing protein, partial [Anaerolineae bacterium]|nr:DUF2207 domain-containing protein [Anaerolineae bacterium]